MRRSHGRLLGHALGIHGYYDVDLDVRLGQLTDDLPPLIEQLEEVLQSQPE